MRCAAACGSGARPRRLACLLFDASRNAGGSIHLANTPSRCIFFLSALRAWSTYCRNDNFARVFRAPFLVACYEGRSSNPPGRSFPPMRPASITQRSGLGKASWRDSGRQAVQSGGIAATRRAIAVLHRRHRARLGRPRDSERVGVASPAPRRRRRAARVGSRATAPRS